MTHYGGWTVGKCTFNNIFKKPSNHKNWETRMSRLFLRWVGNPQSVIAFTTFPLLQLWAMEVYLFSYLAPLTWSPQCHNCARMFKCSWVVLSSSSYWYLPSVLSIIWLTIRGLFLTWNLPFQETWFPLSTSHTGFCSFIKYVYSGFRSVNLHLYGKWLIGNFIKWGEWLHSLYLALILQLNSFTKLSRSTPFMLSPLGEVMP